MPPDSRQIPRSDADLIGCSQTEPEEFTELFRRHAPHIQRYVTRRLGSGVLNASGADDIVAETFLLAFRQRDRYDPSRADARPWLYGICTNLIGRHRRAEIRQYRAFARTGTGAFNPEHAHGTTPSDHGACCGRRCVPRRTTLILRARRNAG